MQVLFLIPANFVFSTNGAVQKNYFLYKSTDILFFNRHINKYERG